MTKFETTFESLDAQNKYIERLVEAVSNELRESDKSPTAIGITSSIKNILFASKRDDNLEYLMTIFPFVALGDIEDIKEIFNWVSSYQKSLKSEIPAQKKFLQKLASAIEIASEHTIKPEVKAIIFGSLYEISISLHAHDQRAFDESPILSLISKKGWSVDYTKACAEFLIARIQAIKVEPATNSLQYNLICKMIEELLKCENRFSEWKNSTSLSICSYTVQPGNRGWREKCEFLDFCKEVIFDVPNPISISISNGLSEMISDLNRAQNENNRSQLNEFFASQFKWMHSAVLDKSEKLPDDAVRALRTSWNWFLKWCDDKYLSNLALDCEKKYFGISDYELYSALFDFSNQEIRENAAKKIESLILSESSVEGLWRHLTSIRKISAHPKELHQYHQIIQSVGETESFFETSLQFIDKYINSDDGHDFAIMLANATLKYCRTTVPDRLNHTLQRIYRTSNQKSQALRGFYSGIHPTTVGVFTEIDINFLKSKIHDVPKSDYAQLFTSLSCSYWNEASAEIDSSWRELSDEQKTNIVYQIIEKLYLHSVISKTNVGRESILWILEKIFILNDPDDIANCEYSLENMLKAANVTLPLELLYNLINSRIQRRRQHGLFAHLPSRIPAIYKVFSIDASDLIALQAIVRLYVDNKESYWSFGKIFPEIDSDGTFVASVVNELLCNCNDLEELSIISTIPGFYKDGVPGWEIMAVACVNRARLLNANMQEIYSGIDWHGIKTYSGVYGEIAPQHYEELNHAKARLEHSNSALKEYWQLRLDYCQAIIDREASELAFRLKGQENA